MNLPTPGLVAVYDVSTFDAADAARIVALTGKRQRVAPADAAPLINDAVRDALADIGRALASPPGEQARWAERLVKALGESLALLAPGGTDTRPVAPGALVDALARLFPGECPTPIEEATKRHGFASLDEALKQGIVGLWLVHAMALHAREGWRKKVGEKGKSPNPLLLIWLQAMGALYVELVEAMPSKSPTTDSPFIVFCAEIGRKILDASGPAPAAGMVMRQFLAMLRDAKKRRVVQFMRRHSLDLGSNRYE